MRTHDFKDKQLGKVAPYGVYDLKHDEGFVSVGISFDTAQFSVASILAWWQQLGRQRFPAAGGLLITADCGASNANRSRLWKVELGKLADLIALPITVCHFLPGTSKWNRGKPLISDQVIISLIAATTTRSGLKVHARIRRPRVPQGHQGQRRRAGGRQPHRPPISPGMELHHQPADPPPATGLTAEHANAHSAIILVVIDERPIAYRYELIAPHLTDRELRLWAAAEASVAGPPPSPPSPA